MVKIIIVFCFICSILTACFLSTWDVRLVLTNDTQNKIRYFEEIMDKEKNLPNLVNCDKSQLYSIEPNSDVIIRRQEKWEFSLRDHPEKILRIYIINEDSLAKYGTCFIFKKGIFMKRFDFNYYDLEKVNWKLEFSNK